MKNKLFTLPNILTLANLACGCAAVVYALGWFDPKVFFWLIAAAAVFDFLDGMTARLTRILSASSGVSMPLNPLCPSMSTRSGLLRFFMSIIVQ